MSDWPEPPDEAIDRVAALLTTTPVDHSLPERVVARLAHRSSAPLRWWTMGLATATAAGLFAVWLRPGVESDRFERPILQTQLILASRPTSDLVGSARFSAPVAQGLVVSASRPARRHPSSDVAMRLVHAEGGLELLPGPVALSIASIERPALPEVAPLAVPSIEIPPLAVTESPATPETKE